MSSRLLNLKYIIRTGWLMHGVEPCNAESVTDHSFLVAYIFIMLSEYFGEKLELDEKNVFRGVVMALIHDLPEIYIGDLTPPLTRDYKWIKEELEKDIILKNIRSRYIKELFIEYSARKSITSKIVKLADIIATIIQGLEYRGKGYSVDNIIDNLRSEAIKLLKDLGLSADLDELIKYVMYSLE